MEVASKIIITIKNMDKYIFMDRKWEAKLAFLGKSSLVCFTIPPVDRCWCLKKKPSFTNSECFYCKQNGDTIWDYIEPFTFTFYYILAKSLPFCGCEMWIEFNSNGNNESHVEKKYNFNKPHAINLFITLSSGDKRTFSILIFVYISHAVVGFP
jgi:hypothetical protein